MMIYRTSMTLIKFKTRDCTISICHVWINKKYIFTYLPYITGWWFGTFFIFHNIWDNPSRCLIFFKMVKTTNQYNPNIAIL